MHNSQIQSIADVGLHYLYKQVEHRYALHSYKFLHLGFTCLNTGVHLRFFSLNNLQSLRPSVPLHEHFICDVTAKWSCGLSLNLVVTT